MAILVVIDSPPAPNADPEIDRRDVYQRGDVVAVLPDEHEFSARELASPRFAFFAAPGVPAVELLYLTGDDPETVAHATRRSARATGQALRVQNQPIPPGMRWRRRRYFYDFAAGEVSDKHRG